MEDDTKISTELHRELLDAPWYRERTNAPTARGDGRPLAAGVSRTTANRVGDPGLLAVKSPTTENARNGPLKGHHFFVISVIHLLI